MKSHNQTLRQLIESVEAQDQLQDVFKCLYVTDSSFVGSVASFEKTKKAYSKVIAELKKKRPSKGCKFPILVRWTKDFRTKKRYADVCLLNPRYVEPPKGLKPWGGKRPPKGYYNINLNKYNKYFAFGYSSWAEMIDTRIIFETNKLKPHEVLAEILSEITFNGFTEKDCELFNKQLQKRLTEAVKQIERGEGKSHTPDDFRSWLDSL